MLHFTSYPKEYIRKVTQGFDNIVYVSFPNKTNKKSRITVEYPTHYPNPNTNPNP